VIRAAPRYEASAQFRTYLYAIALKILRAYRRKAAFRATFLGTPAEHAEPGAESGLVTQLLMRDAIRKLEVVDREILLLREFEQLSYGEIAELLKLPVNTVRSRLFRARMALRKLLSENAPLSGREMSKQEEGI
jgi:RNA polymerase sigma-70 factor (ECF subfamily)